MSKGALDLVYIYGFLKRLVTPFEKWEAFDTGVIDKDGKILVDKNNRTAEQDRSWGYYDRLMANLKKLLAKVPGGRSRLGSFAAALLLLREHVDNPDDELYLQERLDHYMGEAQSLMEEAPVNAAGGGNVAGVGVGPDGEPGVPKKRKKVVLKRTANATSISV